MSTPAANARSSAPDELQLPLLGLYADLELGRGSVHLPDEFSSCSNAVQLEVLESWLQAMARYRRAALLGLHRDLAASRPDLNEADHMALLRSTCASLGVQIPADFAAALASR